MSALIYAMDAMLYMTTGMLDRHDEDIMVETAICKLFCSEMGWRVVNDSMQIMGGEGYMTENEVERIFRDSRINLIVEGANEVMQSFIFAYGGKQLAEYMLGVREHVWSWRGFKAAMPLGLELFLGIKPAAPKMPALDPGLRDAGRRFSTLVRDLSHNFKLASKRFGEKIVAKQAAQARLADAAMWLHAWVCTLSKLNSNPSKDRGAAMHFFDMAEQEIRRSFHELFDNADISMNPAADEALRLISQLPNSDFAIPEASPNAKGTGRVNEQDGIKQFPRVSPSPSILGEGRGEGSSMSAKDVAVSRQNPHPNPPPDYQGRGKEADWAKERTKAG
ncbi:MAG TPA: acyl-CoA dehydrogenase family protein, partial [Tepidisphaeraceae bacterium]